MNSTSTRNASAPRIGLVGSGFLAKGIIRAADAAGYRVGPVLTRRPLDSSFGFPLDVAVTNHAGYLIEHSDLIVECSGDPIHATEVVDQAMKAGLPVVTMNSEFHVTTGSWFADKGIITEGEGDQPGCLAALRLEALAMGFEPLVYGNVKGFLNHHPSRSDMEYYSQKQGTSLSQTTSFTDGTKLQIEQALVANAFGADIYRTGLLGPVADSIEDGSNSLAGVADMHGRPISDYIILPGSGAVFITARHDQFHRPYLSYMKMGDGPFYTLTKNYHLCHLEVIKTVHNVIQHGANGVLLNNTATPRIGVTAIAKREMGVDHIVERGIGSFEFRGEAIEIASAPDHVPIGLLAGARIRRKVRPGHYLTLDDVELADTFATDLWFRILDQAKVKAA
ncbi:MAG: NAD(P)-dependent oxidoreductase [Verrucomicrobiales bacterium]|nr:NAD(P)-dependent oxidoreductase [Verrucomicrobiales bacterium]